MKYAVITFGCRVNQADSLGLEEELLAGGADATPPDQADLVIVNTCSVTATADQGARQTIRRIARDNPSARIVVTGCYATRRPDELRELPNVAHVATNEDKPRLVSLIRGVPLRLASPHRSQAHGSSEERFQAAADRFGDGDGACGATIEPGVVGRTAYTLRVQTGCDEPCAYCIIPSTRGAPRSIPITTIVREVERVASAGFKEIALTGVHLGSYGRDLMPRASLVDLLRALDTSTVRRKVDSASEVARVEDLSGGAPARLCGRGEEQGRHPDVLFRISSLEPMDCTPDVVDLVAGSSRFAAHFHLPLQHASDRVLRAMRRPYTAAFYAALVNDIRSRIPHASIGSDVIVGFPGETDADVDELVTYLERSPLSHIHVFPYSDRPGTAATAMKNKVHGAAVRERAQRVREVASRLTAKFRALQIGTTHRALTIDDGSLAVTGNYLKVRIPPGHRRNEWIVATITGCGSELTAEVRSKGRIDQAGNAAAASF